MRRFGLFAPHLSSQKRPLHILSTYKVLDEQEKLGALILETKNDIKEKETHADYLTRSWADLNKALFYNPFEPQEELNILILKVNQSVIELERWQQKKEALFTGHVIAGVFHTSSKKIEPHAYTLVSKAPTGMESDEQILKDQFFSSKFRSENGAKFCSREYYVLMNIRNTSLSIGAMKKRLQQLHSEKEPYHLATSACGQAVYFALTGLRPRADMSTQTATIDSVLKIIPDKKFYNNMRRAVHKAGLNELGYDIGNRWKLLQANNTARMTNGR